MKKILALTGLFMVSSMALMAYEVDPNSVFGNRGVGLRPFSTYTITCPSIIENVNTGDRSNLRFFFMDQEPFEQKARAANRLIMKTFNTSSSYFELFTQDGNTTSVNFNINNKNKKMGAIAGNCRIEP